MYLCACEYSPRVVAWILLLIKVRKFCSISRMGYEAVIKRENRKYDPKNDKIRANKVHK